ncbi:MAG: NAD(+)/NADH kinase [Candidatus Eisenbacteria bacterium]|nr:NAD(+)/NADH kinase [Candidatus Eisenbacteria bacterium]
MKTVGIIGNPRKGGLGAAMDAVLDWCGAQGLTALVQEDLVAALRGRAAEGAPVDRVAAESDLVFALGGDGTLLAAVRAIARTGREVPVFGVNLGSLGFLTQVGADELPAVLADARAGALVARPRMMLAGAVERTGGSAVALNDFVVRNGAASRMLSFEARVDGDLITRFAADGIILSTPTGSTAYALSAGGPVVMPGVEAIVVTPICPHSLSIRACVLPPTASVEVRMLSSDGEAVVSVDGDRLCGMETGDAIVVRRAERSARLIEIGRHSYYEILGRKLRWSGRVVER